MRILVDRKEIKRAQQAFEDAVSSAATKQMLTRIGYRSGDVGAPVYWIDRADIWGYLGFPPEGKPLGRYWNAFGPGKPGTAVSITCEINPPLEGINRYPAGAFGRSEDDLYILHRGKFHAGRPVRKDFIEEYFRGCWRSVHDGDRVSRLLVVGKLADSHFVDSLHKFVAETARVKDLYRSRR